ncbi:hypothetical protein [Streptomyces sp. NPDC087859]|uniref:hypothetical protein n=1 Tax=Streptomyces sp. NPDC087859 TaxID=3365812 RepID=UPI0038245047
MSVMEARGERSVSAGGAVGVAVTGDNNRVLLAPGVRSAYWEQVLRIAPPEIMGRESELEELATFCAPDRTEGPSYGWWRAEAWAGKTALMAWFALHPPPRVRIVPFFVTARWRAQNDVVAFGDVVLEQLAELAEDSLPAHLTEATRDAHLLRLYEQAARICRERGEQLVLLVDGLDEDRGVTTGPDAHSIAGVLPPREESGIRVIVSGRLNPPLPTDVPENHPLRDPRCARRLVPSQYAQAVRTEAERELKTFLAESRVSRDLLGFVVAAESGLTTAELAHLSDETDYGIKDILRTRAGRTFAIREIQPLSTPGRPVHLLAHEELQRQAADMLGPAAVESYRQRLHDWGDEYRDRGWPPDTPAYLLRGYFQMLRARRDVERVILCAADSERHDRLLHASGSDSLALAEIRDASNLIIEEGAGRLSQALELAIHRNALEERTSGVTLAIPAAWVCAGEPSRGEAVARSFPGRRERALALAEVGERLTGTEALRVLDEAVAMARQEPDEATRERVLVRVLVALLWVGQYERAEALAAGSEKVRVHSRTAHWIVDRLVRAGERARVDRMATALGFAAEAPIYLAAALAECGHAAEAEDIARATASPGNRKLALIRLAAVQRRMKQEEHARLLIEEALSIRAYVRLTELVPLLAAAGEVETGLELVRKDAMAEWRFELIVKMIAESAQSGHMDDVKSLLRLLPVGPHLSAGAAAAVTQLCRAGDMDEAFRVARLITEDLSLSEALLEISLAKIREGQVEDALRIGGMLAEEDGSIDPLVRISVELSLSGSPERARDILVESESLARRSVSTPARLRAAFVVASVLAGAGLAEASRSLLDGAEHDLATLPARWAAVEPARRELTVLLARALADADYLTRAESLAARAGSAREQERIWVEITQAMVVLGRFDDAERAARVPVSLSRSRLPFLTAVALAEAGEFERAVDLARGPEQLRPDAWALAEIGHELLSTGRPGEAGPHIAEAEGHASRAPSVRAAAALARVLARSGDASRAQVQMDQAELLAETGRITGTEIHDLAQAMVALGNFSRAASLVDRVPSPSAKAAAQADLVEAYVRHDQRERAELLTLNIRAGREAAQAHLALARTATASGARTHLAQALHHGWWPHCLPELLKFDPGLASIAIDAIEGWHRRQDGEADGTNAAP